MRRWKVFPVAMHPWQFNNREYLSNETCIRRYAAELTTIDDGIGELLSKLETIGRLHDTLIVFTGDNGWSGGQHGVWGMGDHTRPKCVFDPTMRVPLIWWQPNRIKPPVVQEHVSHVDFFPPLLAHLSLQPELPAKQKLTGHDYSLALRGEPLQPWDDTVFYEYEDLRCVRTPTVKWVHRHAGPLDELYDLKRDPGEQASLNNDASAADCSGRRRQLCSASSAQTLTPALICGAAGLRGLRCWSKRKLFGSHHSRC